MATASWSRVASRTVHVIGLQPASRPRFDYLTAQASPRPVEDLLARDAVMAVLESVWLLTFVAGLWELIP